jgi:hypothetical protein
MVLNKTAVKKLFNDAGVQVNILALNNVDSWALTLLEEMVQCASKLGIRRLTPRKITDILPDIVEGKDA